MKFVKNSGASKKEMKDGYCDADDITPQVEDNPVGEASDDHDLRRILTDDEAGGFCGRAKGGER